MDRDDARFVVKALESRIAGDRDALAHLSASSLVHLTAAALRLKQIASMSPPGEKIAQAAHLAALELETIAYEGAAAADADAHPDLQIFVDKLRELADEPLRPIAPRNREERRRAAAIQLPRRERVIGRRSALSLH